MDEKGRFSARSVGAKLKFHFKQSEETGGFGLFPVGVDCSEDFDVIESATLLAHDIIEHESHNGVADEIEAIGAAYFVTKFHGSIFCEKNSPTTSAAVIVELPNGADL